MNVLKPGVTGAAFPMAVELGKVREFARATEATDRSYYDDCDPAPPPTFLITAELWSRPGSSVLHNGELSWGRLLSGGSEFVFHGPPIRAGEPLNVMQRVTDVYTKSGRRAGPMTFIHFTVEFRRPDGSLAAEERHVTIETHNPPGKQPDQARIPATPARRSTPERTTARPTKVPADYLLMHGSLPVYVAAPVSRTGIVRYQGASGDLNPIHHDDDFARTAGYPGVFSVGMYHAGILGSYLADVVGATAVRRFRVQFREQVWLGDVLHYGATVLSRSAGTVDGPDTLELDLYARLADGRAHIRASATVEVGNR